MNFFTVYIILKGIYIWLLGNNDTKKKRKGPKGGSEFFWQGYSKQKTARPRYCRR